MINVLDRITELREEKNWTEYQLAERSGLTQSTISSWYRKKMYPTLPSLEKICIAFDISLSQFFDTGESEATFLNSRQQQLIKTAERLSTEQYISLLNFLEKL